jgi:hypothetical protein
MLENVRNAGECYGRLANGREGLLGNERGDQRILENTGY